MKSIFSFLLLSILLFSCNSNTESIAPAKKENPPIKNFVEEIKSPAVVSLPDGTIQTIKINEKENYTIYLPSDYSPEYKYPVILFFDPHARGWKPIIKYAKLAENFKYILVGSNFSRNNLPESPHLNHLDNLINDVTYKFSVDLSRINLSGFSGGARVALLLASKYKISSVIGCGAGYPGNMENPNQSFNYIGMVGFGDFNYGEMNQLENKLIKSSQDFYIHRFIGKHDWPRASEMRIAFQSMVLEDMRKEKIQKSENIISQWLEAENEYYQSSVDTYLKNQNLKRLLYFYRDLTDLSEFKKDKQNLINSEEYKQMLSMLNEIEIEEKRLIQEYSQSVANKKLIWWQQEYQKIQGIISTSENLHVKAAYERILAYVSLLSYGQVMRYYRENSPTQAEFYLRIYQIVDPTNPDGPILEAMLYAFNNNQQMIRQNISRALDMGYDKISDLRENYILINTIGQPEIESIVNDIKYRNHSLPI